MIWSQAEAEGHKQIMTYLFDEIMKHHSSRYEDYKNTKNAKCTKDV